MFSAFIIDDDKISADVTYMMFSWEELNVSKVEKLYSTSGLVEKILIEKPHIVFIDIEMGTTSGLDILRECKENLSESLFVIVSGHDNFDYAHASVNLGAIYYLLKPFDAEDVEAATKKIKNALVSTNFIREAEEENLPNDLWRKIENYIEKNYTKKIQALDICSEFYISPATFYNVFKNNSQKTFVEYLTHFRIEKAKSLLATTKKSLPEISESVGIKDHYYFNKIFKKHTGLTPLEFRNKDVD